MRVGLLWLQDGLRARPALSPLGFILSFLCGPSSTITITAHSHPHPNITIIFIYFNRIFRYCLYDIYHVIYYISSYLYVIYFSSLSFHSIFIISFVPNCRCMLDRLDLFFCQFSFIPLLSTLAYRISFLSCALFFPLLLFSVSLLSTGYYFIRHFKQWENRETKIEERICLKDNE